ncbi:MULTISPECIES: GNAT family N-acetyltransferase [Nitrospirillum]|uniref:Acetyltransferase (GNAT) family protein n=1 Tax=Nitrospirillum amazonense TaxID=28077 RepID=A0A560EWM0_9PROT|nr:GNAT family N-acetyltransferase [Nitrospirillum amazonense]MEC4594524.1 GNAT family N-acetyltransferase [Nitrospirillum amazonense]TWB13761.1 acetyltransferase (GNAT) family protein [Nitrospirillum amazonense]
MGFRIEPLAAHGRAAFACGVPALDRYFREIVTQDIRRRVSNCFIALSAEGTVAAYYTLAATSLPITDLPAEDAVKLPRYPLLPAGLIGRLAVDDRFKGQGLGSALIVDAIGRVARADPAVFALVVDAKDEAAVRFYQHLGFQSFISHPMKLYLPVAAALKRLASQAQSLK